MHFRRIISKEGWELRLHEQHEIFSIPIFQQLNYDEPINVSYTDLYMLAFNNTDYSLLSKEEIVSHLELLDMICYVNKQKELLDHSIKEYNSNLNEWKPCINPSIIEIEPQYLLTFPEFIDFNLEKFSKLNDCDDLKRKKLLQYIHDNNFEAFSILFDKSLINGKFMGEIIKCGLKWIEIIVQKGFDYWNKGMCYAAKGGNKELVDFFIAKGANDWNLGLIGAARGGNKALVDFFIYKGANYWDGGMTWAALEGHKDLVDFFIEKGATSWNSGMYFAAEGGHKDLVDFFISKGADDWNEGMQGASRGGYKELVLFFINKGANNWNEGMRVAALGGHKELVELFIQKGANDWNNAMRGAAKRGDKELVDLFISKGADNWDQYIIYAGRGRHKHLVDFFVSKWLDGSRWRIYEYLENYLKF